MNHLSPASPANQQGKTAKEHLRLFVALELDPAATEHLENFVSDYRSKAPDEALEAQLVEPDASLRWIPATRWHVTLAFLGSVEAARVPRIERQIARCLPGTSPAQVRFSGGGSFRHAVYVKLQAGDWLTHLAEALRWRLSADTEFPFVGHVTVARARGKGRPVAPAWMSDYRGPAFLPTTINLISSTLGPVPEYRRLRSWQLEG